MFVKGSRYEKMMDAFGGVGAHVTTTDELKRAVNQAMDSGKPVVPVTILGTYESWPKTRFALHRGTAIVIFHAPVNPHDYADRDLLTDAVRDAIASALPPERSNSQA